MCCEMWTFQELDLQEQELRQQLSEVEDIRFAMTHDPAFMLLAAPPKPNSIALADADYHKRIWADSMSEGALTVQPDGTIIYCNARFAEFVEQSVEALTDTLVQQWIVADEQAAVNLKLQQAYDHRTDGEFHLRSSQGKLMPVRLTFRPFDSGHFSGVCLTVTDITEQHQVRENLQYVSTHDTLTGLYNQNYFYTELVRFEHSRAYPVTVGFIDLDGMRAVNEKLGHVAGDDLLKRATSVLQSAFRSEDIVARVGGDEFAILLPNTDVTTSRHILSRIQTKLSLHNSTHRTPELSFSIGVATAEKGQSLTEALKQADHSMYEDKRVHHKVLNLQPEIQASVVSIIDASNGNGHFNKTNHAVG